MSYPYTINTNVPNVNNYPGDDQPIMQQNYANINAYLGVDHVNPGGSGAGFHEKVTFNTQNVPGSLPTDPVSVCYTGPGSASIHSQIFFNNQDAKVLLSLIKAYGCYSISGSTVTTLNSININTVTRTSTGNYTVTLTTGATIGTSFGVLVSCSGQLLNYQYTITGANTFNLSFRAPAGGALDPNAFTLQIMQY